jgi:uncharacterized protein YdaU (DUF1376 family)
LGSDHFFFPFFWKDFQLSTARWTDEQVGAYLRLLMWAWDEVGLPIDEQALMSMGDWSVEAWSRIWPKVGPKFIRRGRRLFNLRQEEIRQQIQAKSDKARAAAFARHAQSGRTADALPTQGDRSASKAKQSKAVPPPTPPRAEGRPTRAQRKAALRAVGPSAGWRGGEGCPHEPRCSVPTHCALLSAKAEHPDEVPA